MITNKHTLCVSRAATNILLITSMIPLMLMGYFILREFDERFFPPLVDIRAVDYLVNARDIHVHVVGRKVRECERLSVQGWYRDENGNNVPMRVDGVNEHTDRLTGPTDFGWWVLRPRPDGGLFWVAVKHRCNPAYDQKTILGPFVYKEFENKTKNMNDINRILERM